VALLKDDQTIALPVNGHVLAGVWCAKCELFLHKSVLTAEMLEAATSSFYMFFSSGNNWTDIYDPARRISM